MTCAAPASVRAASYSLSRNIGYALAAGIGVGGLGVLRGFWVGHSLDPPAFAQWNLVQLCLAYGVFFHLNAGVILARDLVAAQGAGLGEAALRCRDAGVAFFVLSTLAGAAVLALAPASVLGTPLMGLKPWILIGFVTQQLFVLTASLLQAELRYDRLFHCQIAYSLMATLLTVILTAGLGVKGAILGISGGYLAAILGGVAPATWAGATRGLQPARLIAIAWAGLPLTAGSLVNLGLQNLDRIVVARGLGRFDFSQYSVANLFAAPVLLLPSAIAGAFLSHFARTLGREGGAAGAQAVQDIFRLTAVVMAYLTAAACALTGAVLRRWLPAYGQASDLVRILLVASYFYALTPVLANYLIAAHRQRPLLVRQIVGLACMLAGCSGAVAAGFGTRGVALANLASYLAYLALLGTALDEFRAAARLRTLAWVVGILGLNLVAAWLVVRLGEGLPGPARWPFVVLGLGLAGAPSALHLKRAWPRPVA